ncbi:MAG TPA: hypothetical protein VJR89_10680 [Polyangiales bacterium]|nr:hypothetical protein [Polyangiales bacterium]
MRSRFALACSAWLLAAGCAEAGAAVPREIDAGGAEPEAPPECVRRELAVSIASETTDAVPAGTPVTYRVTIANRDEPSCEPERFLASLTPPTDGLEFRAEPESLATEALAGGESVELGFTLTSRADQDPGDYALGVFVRSQDTAVIRSAKVADTYRVRTPEQCYVAPSRGLLVRHVSVVDDPERTAPGGAWTFGRLMQQALSEPSAAAREIEAVFASFAAPQEINGFRVAARPNTQGLVLDPWPRTEQGELDLMRAPFRLLAIAHRLDLANVAERSAGEGRFVYGVLDRGGASLLFTVILEYQLPTSAGDWGAAVHALQAVPFPSPEYNAALQQLTDRYTARGAAPQAPNGSALLRVRTNENALGRDGRWEMREFRPARASGVLEPAALAQTPDTSFNGSPELMRFIESNRASILRESHAVPALFEDSPFQAGALINTLEYWTAAGLGDSELRHKFSLNTCSGCHGGETSTSFFQVFPRAAGEQSRISDFLTGVSMRDPVTGEARPYNELARRRQLLESTVCGTAE